jgi:hypothetical protein
MAKAKYKKLKHYAQLDNEPLFHEGHKKPVTRRDFLAQGLIGGGAFIMGPSLLGGVLGRSSEAYAAAVTCGAAAAGGAGKVPFMCFDLAGGANVAGSNVMVGGPGPAFDPTVINEAGWIKLGLLRDQSPLGNNNVIDTRFGLPFHSDSAFLRGMIDKMSAGTIANTNGAVICARSANDTGNNPHNPMYGIAKAGADGQLVTLIGSRSSDSGGRSVAPDMMIDLTIRPTKVDRASDAMGLADAGRLGDFVNANGADDLMATIESMSHRKVDQINEGQMIHDLANCGYEYASDNMTQNNPNDLDPNQDPDVTAIFNNNELGNSKFRKTAAVMKLVVNGYAGAGTVENGGYDYHGGTRGRGEVRDFEAGQSMGAALEYAARKNKELMIYVFSDGSVASDGNVPSDDIDGRGKPLWKGDNGGTAAVFMLAYSPNGRPTVMQQQIGYFQSNGSVDTGSSPLANNVDLLAQAIVLNYLALHGEQGNIDQVLPGHGLGAGAAIDQFIAFAPLPGR